MTITSIVEQRQCNNERYFPVVNHVCMYVCMYNSKYQCQCDVQEEHKIASKVENFGPYLHHLVENQHHQNSGQAQAVADS